MPDTKPTATVDSQPSSQPFPLPQLIPLPPRALLRRLEPATAASPYIVPDSSKEPSTEAEVVAIPSAPYLTEWGVTLPCPVKPGDRCLVGKYTGNVKFRGEDVLLCRWDEILAVIPPDEPADPTLPKRDDTTDYTTSLVKGTN